MKNVAIRRAAAANGIFLWKIAERLNISDSCLSRKLRQELSAAEQEKIFIIIKEIAKEESNGSN